MSEIKSALELALERTADVKSDKSRLEAHDARQTGMRIAGRFLDDPSIDVARELKDIDRDKRQAVREGFYHVLLSHLALPSQESDVQRLGTVQAGFEAVIRDKKLVQGLMDQVIQYMQQYLDTKNQLTERLREQFEPRLRQKEQQIAAQTGRQVRLDPANDPEFSQALNDHVQQLQSQYGQVVNQAKEQFDQLFSESK
jgi:nucleoid DNA-binding protein